MTRSSSASKVSITIAFACVYLCWGSTYAAIRVAGMHLAPQLVAGCRSLLSTAVICGICVARGKSLRVPASSAWKMILIGVLMMSVNNVLLTWSETMIASGLASLVIATIPIMVALMETVLPGGEALNKRGWLGVMLGTAGMVALLWPSLHRGVGNGDRHLLAFGILLVAGLAFAVGSVLSRRFRFPQDMFVVTAWELGSAGLVNISLAVVTGSFHRAVWTQHGVMAIVYLSIFGSVVGLTSFTYLLQHVPVTKVATYAFVNPLVAVLLGVVLLHERLQPSELLGMAIIVAAVATVIASQVKKSPVAPLEDATEVEA